MPSALMNAEPTPVWKHFEALAAIPRPSKKEDAARNYVLAQAKRLGLEAIQDKVGNVVIRKPAKPGREKAPMALLQGHLDMVCEKNEGTAFDFDKDGIKLVRDGDWLKADGTTLGSDNGVGVAAALAVMESNDINHGPLEFVFTIDEETGLTGAAEFEAGVLKSKYFLNLDNEETGTICIGCSGGVNTTATRKVTMTAANPGQMSFRIKVSGLKGGHSGVDIHLGRGNAVRILGAVLQRGLDISSLQIGELKGGSAHNAIPREAWAIVTVDPSHSAELKKLIAQAESDYKSDLGGFDPDVQITLEDAKAPEKAISPADARAIADLLVTVPHGVIAMSPDVPGLVQNSTNLATVSMKGDTVEIVTSQRSAIQSSRDAVARIVATVCRIAGFEISQGAGYPGWKPDPNSEIVQKLQAAHQEVFGKPAKLIAMHAGLECGVIGERYPGMQMASFGPQIENPHSPNERVQISSVEMFWKLLRKALEVI